MQLKHFLKGIMLSAVLLLSSCKKEERVVERIEVTKQATRILSNMGTPTDDIGELGDFYIDLQTSNLYGPKTAMGWRKPISLKGNQGPKGDAGIKGVQGPKGEQGPKGNTGPKGQDGVQGTQGQDGAQGEEGSMIHSGENAPADALGKNGDWYIDTLNKNLYGPKDDNGWRIAMSLI